MKIVVFFLSLLLVIFIGFVVFSKESRKPVTNFPVNIPVTTSSDRKSNMNITSFAFKNNEMIPTVFTCDGQNVNPPLTFSDVPQNTKSLALIMDDPDAPMGTWIHWTVWNISPETKDIAENTVPAGSVEGTTSFGKPGYGGPCPPASQRGEPSGTHHYFFKLYALDAILSINASGKKENLEKAMKEHIIIQSELIGLYSRK